MNRARSNLAASLLIAGALLAGCGRTATATRPGPAPPINTPPAGSRLPAGSPGSACKTRGRSVCATAASNGHSVALAVGWTIEVDLHESSSVWSAPEEVGGQRLLRQLGGVRRAGGGVSVGYHAVAAGKTELRAFARPLCRPRRVCPQFILAWKLHIQVSR
jgi:hypothetical protein